MLGPSKSCNIRALIIRIGFLGPLYYNYNKEPPQNSIGKTLSPYSSICHPDLTCLETMLSRPAQLKRSIDSCAVGLKVAADEAALGHGIWNFTLLQLCDLGSACTETSLPRRAETSGPQHNSNNSIDTSN